MDGCFNFVSAFWSRLVGRSATKERKSSQPSVFLSADDPANMLSEKTKDSHLDTASVEATIKVDLDLDADERKYSKISEAGRQSQYPGLQEKHDSLPQKTVESDQQVQTSGIAGIDSFMRASQRVLQIKKRSTVKAVETMAEIGEEDEHQSPSQKKLSVGSGVDDHSLKEPDTTLPPPTGTVVEEPKKQTEIFSMGMPRPPPKRAAQKPIVYIKGSTRIYRNRCEKYCMGPINTVVEAVGTIVLSLINTLLLTIAIMLIGVGYVIKEKRDPYDEYMKHFQIQFENSMDDLGMDVEEEKSAEELEMYVEALSYPLLVFGSGMASLSLMGIIGACFEIQCLLSLYSRASALVLLFEFSVFLFIYDGEPTAGKLQMYDSLDYYKGVEGLDAITIAWNQVMNSLNCCGVNNYLDFQQRDNWPPKTIKNVSYKLKTPIFCCKVKGHNFTCALEDHANPDNNNMDIGCYLPLYELVFKNRYTMGLFVMLMVFQTVVILFSNWLLWSYGTQITDPSLLVNQ